MINTGLIVRVMRGMSTSLNEDVDRMSTLFKLITRYKRFVVENNVELSLTYLNLIQSQIKESSNEETLEIIMNKLIENKTIPSSIKKYDLSSAKGFLQAMEDEIVREMFSGAAISGPMSGLGSNSQVNSTGMAAPTGPSKKKKKIDAVLMSRYR